MLCFFPFCRKSCICRLFFLHQTSFSLFFQLVFEETFSFFRAKRIENTFLECYIYFTSLKLDTISRQAEPAPIIALWFDKNLHLITQQSLALTHSLVKAKQKFLVVENLFSTCFSSKSSRIPKAKLLVALRRVRNSSNKN